MTVAIVGGGLAGALTARALHQRGQEVFVVDAGDEPGGITTPIERDGYLLEPAAGTVMLPHPHLGPLLDGLDLDVVPATAAAGRRLIYQRGATVALAPGLRLLTSPLLTSRAKLRLLAEPLVPAGGTEQESLETLLVRRLGRQGGRLVAWLMAAGVHAGDPAQLAAGAVAPGLVAAESSSGSLLRGAMAARRRAPATRPSPHVVEGGISRLAGAIAADLGGAWMRSWPVERIERRGSGWRLHGAGTTLEASRVVAAIPPSALVRVLADLPGIEPGDPWAPVAVVWLGTAEPLPEAIGVLVGPDETFAALGFLFESSYAPFRAPTGKGLVKVIVGGATNPTAVDLGDEELVARVHAELGRALGSSPAVELSHVVRHRPGIPQFTAARERILERLHRALPEGLDVAGWAYDGVGVSHLAKAAVHRAESISRGSGSS